MKAKVFVVLNSKNQKIEQISSQEYRVWLKNKPKNNDANKELLKILNKYFNSNVRLIFGFKSRKKIIEYG